MTHRNGRYTDTRGSACEHIGLHYCLEAVFDTKFFLDDRLRVWYRRVDRNANDIQLGKQVETPKAKMHNFN